MLGWGCRPRWHRLYPSLLRVYNKLDQLGLQYIGGNVIYEELETGGELEVEDFELDGAKPCCYTKHQTVLVDRLSSAAFLVAKKSAYRSNETGHLAIGGDYVSRFHPK